MKTAHFFVCPTQGYIFGLGMYSAFTTMIIEVKVHAIFGRTINIRNLGLINVRNVI